MMLKDILNWLRDKTGGTGKVQPAGTPPFEPLEPRLLLSADLIETEPLSLLPVLPNEYAICVGLNQQDNGAQQGDSSVVLAHVDLAGQQVPVGDPEPPIDLPLGADVSGTLDGSGDSDTYSVDVPAGQKLFVQLDADNASDRNELYLRYGALPTLTEYDAAATGVDRSDRFVQISDTQAGTYYVLARCISDSLYSSDGYVIRADTDATLPTLTLGLDRSGTLVNTQDFDLYRVEVGAGQRLVVQLDADNVSDDNELYIRYGASPTPLVYDAAGKEADRSDQYVEVPSTQAGTYYVLVLCTSDALYSSDGYVIRADTDATLATLTLDADRSGTLVNTYDFDLYRVEVEAGQKLFVQLDADNASDRNELYLRYGALPTLTEYDVAATGADRSDRGVMIGTQAGTYYILARCVSDSLYSSDGYVIRADTDATLPTLTLGLDRSGTLVNTQDFDLYRVEVGAGQRLVVQLDADNVSDDNELYIRYGASPTPLVYDAAGKEADRSDQYVEVPSTQAGTYYVLVLCTSDALYSSDGYVIRADTDATLATLTLDADRSGTLVNTYDFDLYRVEVEAGQKLFVQLDADNASDRNELYLRYGALPTLTEYDAAATGVDRSDRFVQISDTQAGTYYVLARCISDSLYSSDGYVIRAATDATLPTLTLGLDRSGTLVNTQDFDLYRVEVSAGQHLMVQLNGDNASDDNELYIRYGALPTPLVYDAAGNEADRSDQYLEIGNTQAGTYYVLVLCTSDALYSSDGYTLRADTAGSLPLLTVPGQVTGSLANSGDAELYRMSLDGSQDVILALQADSAYPQNELYVRLEGLPTESTYDFAAVAPGPNQLIFLESPAAGTYYIMVRGAHTWPQDDFTLTADTELTWHVLDLGQAEAITLLPNEIQLYYVDIPPDAAPGELFLTLQKDSSWHGTLGAGAPGEQVDTRSGSGDLVVEIPIDAAGRYVVQVAAGSWSGTGHLTAGLSLPELTLGEWTVGTIYRTYGSAWYQLDVPADQATLSFEVETLGLWSGLAVFQGTLDSTPDWTASGCRMHLDIPNPPAGRYYVLLTDSAWVFGSQSRDHLIYVDTTGQGGPVEEHAPVITGLSTYTGGTGASVTVIISGAWLHEDATVTLKRDGYPDVLAHYVSGTTDANELTATFDLTGAAPGEWALLVTNPDTQAAQAPQPFTVTSGGEPELWVEIIGREVIRTGRASTYLLHYGNAGSIDASYPWLVVGLPMGVGYSIDLPYDTFHEDSNTQPPDGAIAATLIDLPTLGPGEEGWLELAVTAPLAAGEFLMMAEITPDATPYFRSMLSLPTDIPGAPDIPIVPGPSEVDDSEYPQLWPMERGTPPAGYILMWIFPPGSRWEYHMAKSLGDGRFIEMTPDDSAPDLHIRDFDPSLYRGQLYALRPPNYTPEHGLAVRDRAERLEELYGNPSWDPGDPWDAQSDAAEKGDWRDGICVNFCSSDKLVTNCIGAVHVLDPELREAGLVFKDQIFDGLRPPGTPSYDEIARVQNPREHKPSKIDGFLMDLLCPGLNRATKKIIRATSSISPEDKYGPAGYGAEHWIAADGEIHYRTDFWNKEDAPANTQEVIITDQLDGDLDWSTFSFTRTGFLRWDRPLDGGQYFNIDVDMRPDMNLVVNVEGTFNPDTGEIQWVFRSLDPDTGTWPEDPLAGFLPPITDTGYEIGWVEYTVEQKSDLPTGTQVSNQAWVKFDTNPYNPAPKEGPWINTIDAGGPQSNIQPLAVTSSSAAFLVSWTGQDDASGSGIACYDVYVSTDSGGYTLWMDDATETSATYTGQGGHTYSFYSVARDNVGHQEQAPDTPDATTAVLDLSPVYRFWSPVYSHHFYTMDEAERDWLINNYPDAWTYEGVAYRAFAEVSEPGVGPVYRFWSPINCSHFYTMDGAERDKLRNEYRHVWTYEGIAWYAYRESLPTSGTKPVYRFWSPKKLVSWINGVRTETEGHFYTISEEERDWLIANYPHVWTYELIAWYAFVA